MKQIYYFILAAVFLTLFCACEHKKSQPQIHEITLDGRVNYITDDSTVVTKNEFHSFRAIVRTPHCIYYRISGHSAVSDFWGVADTNMKHRLFPAHRKIVTVWDIATQKRYYLGRWLYSDNWRIYNEDGSLLVPEKIRVTRVREIVKAAESETKRNADITEIVLTDFRSLLN